MRESTAKALVYSSDQNELGLTLQTKLHQSNPFGVTSPYFGNLLAAVAEVARNAHPDQYVSIFDELQGLTCVESNGVIVVC